MSNLDQVELMQELGGDRCRCGNLKRRRQTFCKRCYFALTHDQRRALYSPLGSGYEEAYDDAVKTLERVR